MPNEIIDKLKEAGDYAARLCHGFDNEIFISHNEVSTIRIATNEIIESKTTLDHGLGIRIAIGQKLGFASSGSLDKESIQKTVEMAKIIAHKSVEDKHFKGFAEPHKSNNINVNKNLFALTEEQLNDYAARIVKTAADSNAPIHRVNSRISGSIELVKEYCFIQNSLGVNVDDVSGAIQSNITAEIIERGNTAAGIGWYVGTDPTKFSPEQITEEALSMALKSVNPSVVHPGNYTIIFEAAAMSDILQLLLSAVSAPQIDYGLSFFKDDLNQFVATDEFNLIDDGRHPDGNGSKSVDDEGTPTQRTEIIFNGTLKHFIFDKYYGDKLKFNTTGNGFRLRDRTGRAHNSKPYPHASNFILENGPYDKDNLISETRKGILIPRIWYTYPLNPQLGDFSTTTRGSAFLIENGQIVKSLDKIRIFDNIKKMITTAKIANDQKFAVNWGAGCGLASPTVAFEDVKVSAYDEKLEIANK
ncbi:MAG: TldD/PmbA family protein [Candidatus Aenigmarchaeota archaeon]|nr:TldD/PmbA family protein [Candidatus Aenigmarchaeota archaeon]